MSVTLTLTTEAANNVQSVIAAVADLLKIAYPSTFDVRQAINSNSNLHYSSSMDPNCVCPTNMNNNPITAFHTISSSSIPQSPTISRGASTYKVGRETSISIQSLIDTQPKCCRTCSQRLTPETIFKKRLSELPAIVRELIPYSEPFVFFCNEQCFNACLSTTHNPQQPSLVSQQSQAQLQQQTSTALTVNTSISNAHNIKSEPMETSSPPCTPNDLNDSPNARQGRLSGKRRQENLNKVNIDLMFILFHYSLILFAFIFKDQRSKAMERYSMETMGTKSCFENDYSTVEYK